MKLTRKLAALAMAVLLAVSLTACSPKQVAQDMVVHLVHKLGLVEESDEDDTDTTTKAPAGGSVEFHDSGVLTFALLGTEAAPADKL